MMARPEPIRAFHRILDMFALIDLDDATHMAINVPLEGADKTLPALLGMLEQNTVLVRKRYQSLEQRKGSMSIQLGNTLSVDSGTEQLLIVVPNSDAIIDDHFQFATPELFVSNKKGLEQRDDEIKRLRTELAHVKQQLDDLKETILEAAE